MHIQLLVMCYNSEELILNVLESYLYQIDSIVVGIDSRTKDKTEGLIIEFSKKHTCMDVSVVYFDFTDFSTSRNFLLDFGESLVGGCYQLFIDDSFVLMTPKEGKIKDQLNDKTKCYSVLVNTCGRDYCSKRLIKSGCGIRYTGKIHEEVGVGYKGVKLIKGVYFHDIQCKSHSQRRLKRLPSDLLLLDDTFMGLYYKAMTNLSLQKNGVVGLTAVVDALNKVIDSDFDKESEGEFVYSCLIEMFRITDDTKYIFLAIEVCPDRAFEGFYFLYELSKNTKYLQYAYVLINKKNLKTPINPFIYDSIKRDYKKVFGH